MLVTGSDYYNRTGWSCQYGLNDIKLMTRVNPTGRTAIRKQPDRNTVSAAVRQLRGELGESQQQFASRMQTAIRTIARYETVRPPKGKVLRQLEQLALENRQVELARIFRIALVEEMGGIPLFDPPKPYGSELGRAVHQDLDIATFTWMKQNPNKYEKELRLWRRISRAAQQDLLDKRREVTDARKMIDSVVKLLKQGRTKDEIEDLLKVTINAHAVDMLAVGLDPSSSRSIAIIKRWLGRLPNLFTKK
jgi:transcriptional regulator with XRE-family HTH domain